MRPRPSEIVILVYFAYATLVALALPVSAAVRTRTVAVNFVLLALYPILIRRDVKYLRDWIQLPLMLLGYEEMGWFALPHAGTALEEAWVAWDRALLDGWRLRAIVEAAGPLGPTILELSYTLVYTIGTASLSLLYARRMVSRAEQLLFPVMLGTFAAYSLFPFFPSEPPRTVFPGSDLPAIQPIFRSFNYWLLGNMGIHTSVFPSAHVSTAFSAAFAMNRIAGVPAWFRRGLFLLASLIALSTVYGRYHYLADAVAGFVLALAARAAAHAAFGRNQATEIAGRSI
ncbi:MAG: phosphatase PAP2 family protein [Bryobacteraceae bacterium]